jgi:hypothetical protein
VRELFRIDGEALVPASDKALEWVRKQKVEHVLVSFEKVRSKAQHDFFWASLRALWENQPEVRDQAPTVEHLKEDMMMDLGRCTYHGIVVRPDSIAPGYMAWTPNKINTSQQRAPTGPLLGLSRNATFAKWTTY